MTKIKNSSSFSALSTSFEAFQKTDLAIIFQLILLILVLSFYGISVAYAANPSDSNSPIVDAVPELFLPRVTTLSALEKRGEIGREPIQFNRKLANLSLGSEARLSMPLGGSYVLNFDNRFDHLSGNVTWVGSLQGYGDNYRAVITFGEGGASGTIHTPDGDFLVETDADGEWLVDPKTAGLTPKGPGADDTLIPVLEETGQPLSSENFDPFINDGGGTSGNSEDMSLHKDLAVAATDTTLVTIDVMILYTPGLANQLGSGLSARLDQLVALSNQAYLDSGVYIDLRLVHTQQVEYSEMTSNQTALYDLKYRSALALVDVASLRDTYGADLVVLIRPFDNNTAGSCGVAWVGGVNGQPISSFSDYGYSVVSNGRDVSGTATYCLDLSFVHELGHNMGSKHDRANAGDGSGAYPYSYGYGISGVFGTIMSYISPRVGKFSNPDITCSGSIACGISETALDSANNALSLNNTRAGVAGFRPTRVNPPPTSYTLMVSKLGNGTVIGTGIDCGSDCTEDYDSDTSVTLTATPDTGATFAGWSGACTGMGDCTVTMDATKSVTATFKAIPKYTLTVNRSGSGVITTVGPSWNGYLDVTGINCGTDCSEPYLSGAVVTLAATSANGYYFSGWSGPCTGTGNICTVTMSAAKSVTAAFKANPVLTVRRSGSGTVVSDMPGINCGSDCSESYPLYMRDTLTAIPASGYTFGGWSGACTGMGDCTVTMDATKSVTATFKAIPKYTLMVNRSGSGAITSVRLEWIGYQDVAGINCGTDCSEPYLSGTEVTLVATPASGYYFSGWSGPCAGAGNICTVTMSAAKSVTATFKANPVLTVRRSGSGTVVSDMPGINCGSDCSESYPLYLGVTLTATPASGYTFGGWSGACTGTGYCAVIMDAAKSVTATFKAIPKYTLTVNRSGSGTITSDVTGINCGSDCSEPYLNGEEVTLAATSANGYYFSGWSGPCAGTGNICTVTMSATKSVTATFKANPVLTVRRSGSGTVVSDMPGINCGSDCSESYPYRTEVTLTATPASGQKVKSWVGCFAAYEATCIAYMSGNMSVTATFGL